MSAGPQAPSAALVARIIALVLVTVIIQIVAISQLPVFGVPADLSPLVVMSAGLLLGSVEGAIVGFGVGLFVDLALVQTLGLSALIFTCIGYGVGRVRELPGARAGGVDPQALLVPLAAGAAATAAASIGYAVMQFMLGVDAPVSFLLLRDVLVGILLNTIIALPVFALVRRWLAPCLPEDPRRRRRRSRTSAGLSPLSRT